MSKPNFVVEIESEFSAGVRCFVLTGNLWDYVISESLVPSRVEPYLCRYLEEKGYLVIMVSRFMGYRIYDDGKKPAMAKEKANWLRKWFHHSIRSNNGTNGCGDMNQNGENKTLFTGLSNLLRQQDKKVAIVMEYPQHFVPATDGIGGLSTTESQQALEVLHKWGLDEVVKTTKNRVILLAPDKRIHEMLLDPSSGYYSVELKLPDMQERKRFIRLIMNLRKRGRREFGELEDALTCEQVATLSAGLRLADLEILFRSAAARFTKIDKDLIKTKKAISISDMCGELVEMTQSTIDFERIGGIYHVKDYLKDLSVRLRNREKCPDAPRAILFMGIPGTGKTFVVGALAKEIGWNSLEMRNILSKWVGESERNLERVFKVTEAMSPCILFIDEIDQALAQRGESGDAGTSRRMLKRTMEFLADENHRGDLLFIAATNAPHLLDPAVDDRFSVKIPFLHPSRSERIVLLPLLAAQFGRGFAKDVNFEEVADHKKLDLITVRGMSDIISIAAHCVDIDEEPGGTITRDYLLGAVNSYSPNYNKLQHLYIALIAVKKTNSTMFYPWMERRGAAVMLRDNFEVPGYLKGIVDEASGEVDQDALEEKISETARALQLDKAMRKF